MNLNYITAFSFQCLKKAMIFLSLKNIEVTIQFRVKISLARCEYIITRYALLTTYIMASRYFLDCTVVCDTNNKRETNETIKMKCMEFRGVPGAVFTDKINMIFTNLSLAYNSEPNGASKTDLRNFSKQKGPACNKNSHSKWWLLSAFEHQLQAYVSITVVSKATAISTKLWFVWHKVIVVEHSVTCERH